MFPLPLTKWQAVSKVVNKLSKTNVFALFVRKPAMQKPRGTRVHREYGPDFSEVCLADFSHLSPWNGSSPVKKHWAQVCELLCRFRSSSLQFLRFPMLSISMSLVLAELGYTTPALDLELEAEASNADFTTSGKTC